MTPIIILIDAVMGLSNSDGVIEPLLVQEWHGCWETLRTAATTAPFVKKALLLLSRVRCILGPAWYGYETCGPHQAEATHAWSTAGQVALREIGF